jgi:hypothetical protein
VVDGSDDVPEQPATRATQKMRLRNMVISNEDKPVEGVLEDQPMGGGKGGGPVAIGRKTGDREVLRGTLRPCCSRRTDPEEAVSPALPATQQAPQPSSQQSSPKSSPGQLEQQSDACWSLCSAVSSRGATTAAASPGSTEKTANISTSNTRSISSTVAREASTVAQASRTRPIGSGERPSGRLGPLGEVAHFLGDHAHHLPCEGA